LPHAAAGRATLPVADAHLLDDNSPIMKFSNAIKASIALYSANP
jgi:hypothetical protein